MKLHKLMVFMAAMAVTTLAFAQASRYDTTYGDSAISTNDRILSNQRLVYETFEQRSTTGTGGNDGIIVTTGKKRATADLWRNGGTIRAHGMQIESREVIFDRGSTTSVVGNLHIYSRADDKLPKVRVDGELCIDGDLIIDRQPPPEEEPTLLNKISIQPAEEVEQNVVTTEETQQVSLVWGTNTTIRVSGDVRVDGEPIQDTHILRVPAPDVEGSEFCPDPPGGEKERVDLCHCPPGLGGEYCMAIKPLTMSVLTGAVFGHLQHGDTLGPCTVPHPGEKGKKK